MKKEIWKDIYFIDNGIIYDYRGLYQVSNFGRVKSLKRCVKNQYCDYIIKEKILKNGLKENGYLHVVLWKNSKHKTFYIHRLVALIFIPNQENKKEVNHIDGNKQNNIYSNLEWANSSENKKHAYKLGLKNSKKGYENSKSRKIKQLNKENNILNIFMCMREASRTTNISYSSIWACCNNKRKSAGGYVWRYLN